MFADYIVLLLVNATIIYKMVNELNDRLNKYRLINTGWMLKYIWKGVWNF